MNAMVLEALSVVSPLHDRQLVFVANFNHSPDGTRP